MHVPFQHVDQKDCHVQETNHKCIGQLYVKMANMVSGKNESQCINLSFFDIIL